MTVTALCADMAGTTVEDGDAVLRSFAAAAEAVGIIGDRRADALRYATDTMGQSKIDVFRAICGDEAMAARASAAFAEAYAGIVAAGGVAAMGGAPELFRWCRAHGIAVCLTTGFAPPTREAIIEALGWGDSVDLRLSPADAGRGRPYPDLVLTAAMRLGVTDVRDVAVVGDTVNDLWSGHRAGAGIVAGVTTGAHTIEQLAQAPHTHLLASLADLQRLLSEGAADR